MNTLHSIALTLTRGLQPSVQKELLETVGSSTAIIENAKDIKSVIPNASQRLIEAMENVPAALERAKREWDFIQQKGIKCLVIGNEDYPQRLSVCNDAPLVLYHYGNTDFNRKHIVSIVGTRNCTDYGRDICRSFISDLSKSFPDLLIVSGLAYGIDINAHRNAIDNRLDTVGVLAHGLDRIYPASHRNTAAYMTSHGGLLTEYTSGTTPERGNFLARNRIVAGISDATIIVESASHGGSLVTAKIASSYGRDVLAFPGRITDEYSIGCNNLIAKRNAESISSAEDFISTMMWTPSEQKSDARQMEFFPTLTDEEQKVLSAMPNENKISIAEISQQSGINFSLVTSTLIELEMKGLVEAKGCSQYRRIIK